MESTLQENARACLRAREPETKLRLTERTCRWWQDGAKSIGDSTTYAELENPQPGLPRALRLVSPLQVPRRRLGSGAGLRALLHAVAHIEYNAINLAWDCVIRFRGLPRAFYDDWVRIAGEEARHFGLLAARLDDLGLAYGDLPAHNGLWEMAAKTAGDITERMAMVPRVLEARGLDVTPAMIRRVRRVGDETTAHVMEIILEEEVGHVAAGSFWFRFTCRQRGLEPEATFRNLLQTHMGGSLKGPLSLEHRRRAGFTRAELDYLQQATHRQRTGLTGGSR